MLSLISWLVTGLIVGALARFLMPGRQEMGLFLTSILGIVGALVGGAISWMIWGEPAQPFAPYAWPGYLMAIVGAVLVLLLGRSSLHQRGWS